MFCPIDMAQEHNIRDIKVTYRSEGPNINWPYLKKLHPAIHVIRAVSIHVENEFGTVARGQRHTTPKKELDISKLQQSYRASGYHTFEEGRTIRSKSNHTMDYINKGCEKLLKGKVLAKWVQSRSYKRGTRESWDDMSESDDEIPEYEARTAATAMEIG
jgi:hypothetical protein